MSPRAPRTPALTLLDPRPPTLAMHHTSPLALAALLFTATTAAAQELPSSIATLSERATLERDVGLQPLTDGAGWRFNGPDYGAVVTASGLELTPYLARAERTQEVRLELHAIERGGLTLAHGAGAAPFEATGTRLSRELAPGLVERFDGREDGVELSYVFAQRPAGDGDLVVRLELSGTFAAPTFASDTRIDLRHASAGGVTIGAVTGIDANGATTRGRLVFDGDDVLFVLPDAFVDAAAYPLVLDPLVGPVLTLSTDPAFSTNEDSRPDVAYDLSNEEYLVVWQRAVSASESRIFARRFDVAGAATTTTYQLSIDPVLSGTSRNPSVANLGGTSVWFIVWERSWESLTPGVDNNAISYVMLPAAFTSVTQAIDVHAVFGEPQTQPDVCGLHSPKWALGVGGACVVWRDEELGRIAVRYYDTGGTSVQAVSAVQTLAIDGITFGAQTTYGAPAIARSSVMGMFGGTAYAVVVARRDHALFGPNIHGFLVHLDSKTTVSNFSIWDPPSGDVTAPDVDGIDSRWICAFETTDTSGNHHIQAVPMALGPTPAGITLGAIVDITSPSAFFDGTRPAIAWSPAKTWVGWRSDPLVGSTSFHLRAFDSKTCLACEGTFVLDVGDNDSNEWITVATAYSGGPFIPSPPITVPSDIPPETAFAVWSARDTGGSLDIFGQALANNAGGGSYTNLGGGCGSEGTVSFPYPPSIATSLWRIELLDLPATTALVYYNVTTADASTALPCGSCLWLPFYIAGTPPLVGSTTKSTHVDFVVPCDASFVGGSLIVQWTIVDPASAPCPQIVGLSTSDLWRVTFGA